MLGTPDPVGAVERVRVARIARDELSAEEEEVNLPPMLRKVKCQLPNQIYVRSHPSGPVTLERGFAAEF